MKQTTNESRRPKSSDLYFEVGPGVWGTKDVFVNMYLIRNEADDTWVLVDTGLKSSASKIRKIAARLFGPERGPSGIILTHGHFDHVGSVARLAAEWKVPVYAHYLELPYLTGKSSYPPPDPTVGGGMMTSMAWMYPNKPIDITGMISVLPESHEVPGLPGWKWIHTPGHSPGHISLYREQDRLLIAGDAFVTTRAESALSIFRQEQCLSGPPKYFTTDWSAARKSVAKLASINPEVAATGHGMPMQGAVLREGLRDLSEHFRERAIPAQGRYVGDPAISDANGVLYLPERMAAPEKKRLMLLGVLLLTAAAVSLLLRSRKQKRSSLF